MASFVGTNKEFRRFLGPRLRNLVQQFTKNHKTEISACEHCGSTNNLESAHVHGRGRNEIIDLLLGENTYDGIATFDIAQFEERFKEEHQPLEKSILILCHTCHRQYDSRAPQSTSVPQDLSASMEQPSRTISEGEYLPITLEPSNPDDFKQNLLLTKTATIETYFSDGKVEQKSWNASRFSATSNVFGNLRSRPEYRSGNWQTKGIVKVHVKVVNNA